MVVMLSDLSSEITFNAWGNISGSRSRRDFGNEVSSLGSVKPR